MKTIESRENYINPKPRLVFSYIGYVDLLVDRLFHVIRFQLVKGGRRYPIRLNLKQYCQKTILLYS